MLYANAAAAISSAANEIRRDKFALVVVFVSFMWSASKLCPLTLNLNTSSGLGT